MKKILLFGFTTILALSSYAQLLNENFSYTPGQLTTNGGGANVSMGAWTLIGGTVQLNVVPGNLVYPGYISSNIGNMLQTKDTSASAEDAYTSFTPTSSGTIFYSFLLNVADTSRLLDNFTAGDYMIAFLPSTSTTTYINRLTFKKGSVGNTYNIGLRVSSTGSTTVAWAPVTCTPGTTYLIVSQLVFIPGQANDSAYLWINPTLSGTIPPPDVATVQTGASTDPADIARFAVRQSGGTPESFVDGIRVGTTWATSVLPVKLIDFKAKIANQQTTLSWITASEVNNRGFEVEQSLDGEEFKAIGFVKGAGTSNQRNNYTFNHQEEGSAYYRLKQIDFDGQFEYSPVVFIENEAMQVSLTPNPFANRIEISGKEYISAIEITDVAGKTVLATDVHGTHATINTEQLEHGIYIMHINNGTSVVTKRIMKH